jgi:hypothetical protein
MALAMMLRTSSTLYCLTPELSGSINREATDL